MYLLPTLPPIDEKDELDMTSSSQRLDLHEGCESPTSCGAENLSMRNFSSATVGGKVHQKQDKVLFNKCVNFSFYSLLLKTFIQKKYYK